MKVLTIVGARPNFVKAGPLLKQLRLAGHQAMVVHTGQHFDSNMSVGFMHEMNIGPDIILDGGSQPAAKRLEYLIPRLRCEMLRLAPDCVIVIGDVDSTLAGALAAQSLDIPLVHLEAGLRSGDWSMPEERNRFIVDHFAGLLLTTEESADKNLEDEGVTGKIVRIGNVLVDAMDMSITDMEYRAIRRALSLRNLTQDRYILATFHRQELVDDPSKMIDLADALAKIPSKIVMPRHPRVKFSWPDNVEAIEPVSYRDMICLMAGASMVITDSGGLQEETSALGVSCITYRNNTERPVTAGEHGTNTVIGMSPTRLVEWANMILGRRSSFKRQEHPNTKNGIWLWDGKASVRAVDAIESWLA